MNKEMSNILFSKKICKSIILVFLFFSSINYAKATIYYINNETGNDANSGLTESSAWKTINYAMSTISNGDEVVIMATDTPYNEGIRILRQGIDEDHRLIIRGEDEDHKPIITGNIYDAGTYLATKPYVTIKWLIFDGQPGSGVSVMHGSSHFIAEGLEVRNTENGIFMQRGTDFVVRNCYVRNAHNSGIVVYGGPNEPISNVILENNVVENVEANDCITIHEDGNGNDVGSHFVITGNRLSQCRENAIDLNSGTDFTITDNQSSSCGDSGLLISEVEQVNISNFTDTASRYGAIINGSTNTTISNSSFTSQTYGAGIVIDINGANSTTLDNVFVEKTQISPSQYMLDVNNASVVSNLTIKNCRFWSSKDNTNNSVILRVLHGDLSDISGLEFGNNKWFHFKSSTDNFYTETRGIFNWNTFQTLYAPTDKWIGYPKIDTDNNSQTNSTDALLTLRHSLGLSMTDTDWQESSINGDANCDGTTNSTDALLILRYSLGLDMNGTGWCGG